MSSPYDVVRQFEDALAAYTGAPYVVTTNSCTAAIMLAVEYCLCKRDPEHDQFWRYLHHKGSGLYMYLAAVNIPKRTYVSVPMAIIHAGGWPTFRDEEWRGVYQLKPLPVWDSARAFSARMYNGGRLRDNSGPPREIFDDFAGQMMCLSFHASKMLGDTQGGAILHDNAEADAWLRRARFDGRTEGIEPKDDNFNMIGWHCYLSPDVAARLLLKLHSLPAHNDDLPNSDYPDLSQCEIFK